MIKLWILLFLLPVAVVKKEFSPDYSHGRTPTSESLYLQKTKKDQNFIRASLVFESLNNIAIQKEQVPVYRPYINELEDNLTSDDRQLYWISLASLIIYHHQIEDIRNFKINIRDFLTDQRKCRDVKECLFFLNITSRLAEQFDSENLQTFMGKDHSGLSGFWGSIQQKISIDEIRFQNKDEESYFKYIVKSQQTHLYWNYNLKKNLHPFKDAGFFKRKSIKYVSSSIDDLGKEFEAMRLGDITLIDDEDSEISEFLIDPSYSQSKLEAMVRIWQYRNKLLETYLSRFENRSLSKWFDDKRVENSFKSEAFQRYAWFEVKLPSRNEIFKMTNSFSAEWLATYQEQVQLIDETVISFARKNYAEFDDSRNDELILKAERSMYALQPYKDREFFGFYHDMQQNVKMNLTFISEAQDHADKVKKNKAVYHGSFDFYSKMQEFDIVWLQGQCQVGEYFNQFVKNTTKEQRSNKNFFVSPVSNKNYKRTEVCKKSNEDLRSHLTHLFGLKKAFNAVADDLLIGKSSVIVSVIGYMISAGLTAKVMGPIIKYNAKKTAAKKGSLAYVKSLKDLNRGNIGTWIKYVGAPALIIDYIANAVVITFIRSTMMTAFDYTVGKNKNIVSSFGKYVRDYTIMYLSMPPIGYLVTKAGKLLSVFKFLPGFNSGVTAVKSIKLPEKMTKIIHGTFEQAKITVVESIKFFPVFYVYDVVDYIETGKEIKPTMKEFVDRAEGISTWLILWQAMDHSVSRRFGPSAKEVQGSL